MSVLMIVMINEWYAFTKLNDALISKVLIQQEHLNNNIKSK